MIVIPPSSAVLENLRHYLSSQGWLHTEHANERIEVFETRPDETGGYASIVLPRSPQFRDAGELITEAIRQVASYEGASLEKTIDHVVRWDRDILRSRFFKMHGQDDSLPLGIAADAVSGLKEFMGYAAYAHTNPRPFFDKAGAVSSKFADHCLFGHTFQGSFGLTIECPLSITPTLPLDRDALFTPPERQIIERIANGLATLRESVEGDTIDPLLAGYLTGFNANMCRKLADVYEKADGRRIEYDISWSPQIQSACERVWKPVVFDGRSYEFAKVAASELEHAETFPDSKIEGRIVVLKSEMPPGLDEQAEFEHVITMYWEREKNQPVKIRVPLTPSQYIEACDAHKEGRAIQIFGIPEKAGKFWTLTQAHGFTVLK